MKIQVVSDLHLEFPENKKWLEENPLIPQGDVLLIAGDTIPDKYKKKARKFYQKVSDDFPFIISTMGNHEFYKGIVDYAYPFYQSSIAENHIRLNNRSHMIGDVKFIVSILWTHIPRHSWDNISLGMNDYRQIYREDFIHHDKNPLTVWDTDGFHKESVNYLKEELESSAEEKIIVMTHHVPCFESIAGPRVPPNMMHAYASDLTGLIKDNPNIKYWICGHAHDHNQTEIGNTLVVRNPLGYVENGQQADFVRDFVLEV